MIRHDHSRGIFGAPFRHVTGDATARSSMRARRELRAGCVVTLPAGRRRVADRLLASRRAMGIVTRKARKLALTLGKTAGLPQPVHRTYSFEFVVVPRARRVVEVKHEILERLARYERERTSAKSLYHGRH